MLYLRHLGRKEGSDLRELNKSKWEALVEKEA